MELDEFKGWLRIFFGTKRTYSTYRDDDGRLQIEVVATIIPDSELRMKWWRRAARAILRR